MKIKFLILPMLLLLPFSAGAATIGKVQSNNLGLVGYWTLDGSQTNWSTGQTSDLSGQGNTGQVVGLATSTTSTSGHLGQGFNFPGATNSYLNGGQSSTLSFDASPEFTLSVWVRGSPSQMSGAGIIARGTGGAGEQYTIDVAANVFRFFTRNGAAGVNGQINATVGPSLNSWTLVTGTFSGSQGLQRLYLNGVLAGSAAVTNTLETAVHITSIGARQSASGSYDLPFNGAIDDVRVYNRALSAGEVLQLYRSGSINTAHSNTANNNGLVSNWSFDGSQTNWATGQVFDSSDSANNGKLVAMSTTTSVVAGKLGQALSFNGSTQEVIVSAGATLGSNSITECVWANIQSFTSGIFGNPSATGGIIFNTRDTGPELSPTLLVTDNAAGPQNLLFIIDSNALAVGVRGATTINPNQWYFLCGVFTFTGVGTFGGTWDVYVNGVKDDTTPNNFTLAGTASFPFTGTTWHIGNAPSWTERFNGKMDDLRIYTRALSSNEIVQLYHTGSANVAHSNVGSTTPQGSGLLGYWTFDGPMTNWATGRTTDSSAQGNTGLLTAMSTSTSPIAGKIGQGFLFDGVDSYVNPSSAFGQPSVVSISLWFKTSSLAGEAMFGQANATPPTAPSSFVPTLGVTTGGLLRGELYTGVTAGITSATSVADNKWHHVVLVGNSTNQYLYLDGGLVGSRSGTISQAWWSTTQIGTGYDTGGRLGGSGTWRYFDGGIDDVRVYNKALGAPEVSQLYNAGR